MIKLVLWRLGTVAFKVTANVPTYDCLEIRDCQWLQNQLPNN